MRHAKSDWQNHAIADFDRPLNTRGLRDAPRMAQWLAEQNIKPDLLVSSPALRARQTASEIVNHLDLATSSVVYDKRMYLASLNTLYNIVKEITEQHQSIMLIGHNPGLENFLLDLTQQDLPTQANGSLMTTANIFHLQTTSSWNSLNRGDAKFVQVMRPKELP